MRKITSIVLALAFFLLAITGVQMTGGGGRGAEGVSKYPATQSQQVENNVAVKLPGESPQRSFYPKKAHEWGGYLFIVAGLVHLGVNLKPMKSYLKIKA